ncbi:MAG: HAD family phosphatase [Candidatus Kerfeldbacteria bacterium]|nr:HAD family phosphatase [Candidatus Kerfeldbacteria bacterium]
MKEVALQAILFDFDGTVVESERVYGEVFNQWMWKQKISFALQDRINAALVPGLTWEDCFRVVIDLTKKKFDVTKARDEVTKQIEQYILDVGLPLKQGVRAAIEQLSTQYQLAIVSSSPAKVIERALRHHQIDHYFSVCTTREDITYPKPHPEPYVHTLQAMRVKPEEAIAIEDSLPGAQSAAAAGIFVYVWPDKYFKPEQFANFAKVVYSFDEIVREVI